jgi:cytochrome c
MTMARGLLLTLVFSGAAAAASAAGTPDLAVGKAAFAACASCHQIGPGARAGFGPQLNGVMGRRAGSTTDFKYSEAMKKADFVWDERLLAAFIDKPDKLVPGTKMRFFGLGYDEKKVAALAAYLRASSTAP